MKNQCRGGIAEKGGGLGQFENLSGGIGKKEEGDIFEGQVWYHNAHYAHNLEKERRCVKGVWGFKDIT